MLHEIGRGEPDAVLADANPPLRRSRQGLRYGQGSRVLERNCADYALRAQRFRTAPADSLAIDHIRYQTYRATIWNGWGHLQPRTLGGMGRALRRARCARRPAIRPGTILLPRLEARRPARTRLGFFLARSTPQGEGTGATDIFIAGLRRRCAP